MKEIFSLKEQAYFTRRQQLKIKTPRTITYGLETFGYRAAQIWNSISLDIQKSNLTTIKQYIKDNYKCICKCNLCKRFIQNVGYMVNS